MNESCDYYSIELFSRNFFLSFQTLCRTECINCNNEWSTLTYTNRYCKMAELFTTVGTLHLLIAEASDIFSPHFIPKQLSKLSPKKMLNFNATTTKNVRLVVPTSSPDRPNPNNDPSTTVCAAFAAVCISSDNGDEIYKYDTFVQPCYDLSTDGVVGLGEEFVFESISSTSIISISVYAILSFANNNVIKDKDLDSSIQSRSSYTLFPSRYKASSPENRFESKIERRVVCVGMISIPVSRLEENKKVRLCEFDSFFFLVRSLLCNLTNVEFTVVPTF